MGGFNIGAIFAALKLDDSEFNDKASRSVTASKLLNLELGNVGKSAEQLQKALNDAGLGMMNVDKTLKMLRFSGQNASQGIDTVTDALAKLKDRIASVQDQARAAPIIPPQPAGVPGYAGRQNADSSMSPEWVAGLREANVEFNKAGTALQNIKRPIQEVDKSFEQLARRIGQDVAHPLSALGRGITDVLIALGPVGSVAAIAAAGIGLVAMKLGEYTLEAATAARNTRNLADQLNITWGQTRELQQVAQLAGVNVQTLHVSSWKLAEALEFTSAAGNKTASALEKIGVTGEDSGQLLLGFLQRLADIPDRTERIAMAHQVLGRASYNILPLIDNYDRLRLLLGELGPSLDKNMSDELIKAKENVEALDIAWTKFKEYAAVGVAHIFGDVAKEISKSLGSIRRATPEDLPGEAQGMALFGDVPPAAVDKKRALLEGSAHIMLQALAGYKESQKKILTEMALDWRAHNLSTMDGMKEALTETKKTIKELEAERGNVIKPLGGIPLEENKAKLKAAKFAESYLTNQIARPEVKMIELESQKKHDLEMLDEEERFYKEEEKLGKIFAVDNIANFNSIYDRRLAIVRKAAKDELMIQETISGVQGRSQREAKVKSDLVAAEDAINQKRIANEVHVSDVIKRVTDEEYKIKAQAITDSFKVYYDAEIKREDLIEDQDKKITAHVLQLNRELVDSRLKALALELEGEMQHQTRVLEMRRSQAEFEERIGQITAAQKIAIIHAIDLEESMIQRKAIEAQISLLDKKESLNTEEAAQKQALLNQIQKLQDDSNAKTIRSTQQTAEIAKRAWQEVGRQIQGDLRRAVGSFSSGLFELIIPDPNKLKDRLRPITDMFRDAFGKLAAYSNPQKALEDLVMSIKNAGTVSQANAIAVRYFGETAGPQLARDIRSGALSLSDLKKAMGEAGLSIVDYANKNATSTKGITELWKSLARDIEMIVAKVIVQQALVSFLKWVFQIKDATRDLGKVVGEVFHKIAVAIGLAKDAAKAAAEEAAKTAAAQAGGEAAKQASSAATQAAGGGAASVASGIVGSAFSTVFSMVTGAVTAISSVIGNLQMYGMNKSLDLIVNHTLRIFNSVEQRRMDAWDQYNRSYDRLGELMNGTYLRLDNIFLRLGEVGNMAFSGSGGGGGDIIIQGDVIIQANDPDEMVRQLKTRRVVRGIGG